MLCRALLAGELHESTFENAYLMTSETMLSRIKSGTNGEKLGVSGSFGSTLSSLLLVSELISFSCLNLFRIDAGFQSFILCYWQTGRGCDSLASGTFNGGNDNCLIIVRNFIACELHSNYFFSVIKLSVFIATHCLLFPLYQ